MSRYRLYVFVFTLLLLSTQFCKAADGPTLEMFREKTRELRDFLCTDIKVEGQLLEYDTDPMGKYLGRCAFTVVADDKVQLFRGTERVRESDSGVPYGVFRTPDMLCTVSFVPATKKFAHGWQVTPWTSQSKSGTYVSAERYMRIGYSLDYLDLRTGDTGNQYYPDSYERLPDTVTLSLGELRGRKCIVVSGNKKMGEVLSDVTSYLDPTFYSVLEERKSHKFDLHSKSIVPIKEVLTVEYSPAVGNNPPFPMRARVKYVEPNGKEHPRLDVTYTTYEKYKPSEKELDFEARFGIPPPKVGPRPPLPAAGEYLAYPGPNGTVVAARPGWKSWPLFAAAGALALAVAGIVVVARRRARRGG